MRTPSCIIGSVERNSYSGLCDGVRTLPSPFCTSTAAGEKSQPLTMCHSSHDAQGTRRDISCRAAAALIACQNRPGCEAHLSAVVLALLASGVAAILLATGATMAPVRPCLGRSSYAGRDVAETHQLAMPFGMTCRLLRNQP